MARYPRYPRNFGSPAAKAQSRAVFIASGGFPPVAGAALGAVIESNTATLRAVGTAVALTITGGSYSKNGAAYSTAATTVSDGDTLKVRVTSSASNNTTTSATVTIGGSARTFSVTTAAASVAPLSISGTPAAATVGGGATFAPVIAGGVAPYTLSLLSGALPAGRSLSGLTVTGTYTAAGAYSYTLRVTDSAGSAPADLAVSGSVSAAVGVPTMSFANPTATVTEGDTGTKTVSNTINVDRQGVTGVLTIYLTYAGTATSGTDYAAGPVSLTLADGVSSGSFDLTINGDTSVETDETIIINAALSGYAATASKTITMTNDDVAGGTTNSVPVSDRAWVPTNTASIANNQTSRREHNAPPQGAITNLRFIDLGWYIATVGHVPASSNAYTIKKFLEYPAGVFTQVTWGGATSVVVGVGLQQTSDPVAITIPAGAKYWERTVQISGSAATMPVIELPAGSSAIGASDGNSLSDLGNSGTINPTSGIATIGSAAIIGDIAAANVRTFVVHGDSIAFGEGDISSVGANMSSGWISRGLAGLFAHVRIAKRGQAASEVAGNASSAMANFIASLGNYTDAIFELGINDVSAGRTQAQILADQQTIYGKFPAGVRKWQTTLTPRTSSTNSYADAAGQTVKTDGSMGSLLAINAAIRAKPAGVFGVIDASDYASTARDTGIWSGPFPPTTDGTHPTSAKAAAMGALLTVPSS